MLNFVEANEHGEKRKINVIAPEGKIASIVAEETKDWRDNYKIKNFTLYYGEDEWHRPEKRFYAETVAEAKIKAREWYNAEIHTAAGVKYLPSFDSEFYPTPSGLAGKMANFVDWKNVHTVLEPSAGKGDLCDCVKRYCEIERYGKRMKGRVRIDTIDTIECDENLRLILKQKGYRVIGDDFLDYRTNKRYDLIIMNPPFSNGDEHLLKAIDLQSNGGQIVCVLNAETIRNPYTKRRKVLKEKLADYNARIEFFEGAFKHSERPADVEVAVVYINIPVAASNGSDVFNRMRKSVEEDFGTYSADALVSGTDIQMLIKEYNMEVKTGIEIMRIWAAAAPYLMSSNDKSDKYAKPLISLNVAGHETEKVNNEVVNSYLKRVREKYWREFLDRPQLRGKLTSKMRDDYNSKVEELADYEFDAHNVMQVVMDISSQLQSGVEQSVLDLFDTLSAEYSYFDENQKNIHYYNGWKTNKAHKVSMRAILPINGCYADNWHDEKLDEYKVVGVIEDLERAMNFLDTGKTSFHANARMEVRRANGMGKTKCDFTYFEATFYKKGTCHIKFHEDASHIIDRLNIFAGRKKNWLPPTYGKVHYEEMNDDERRVIDEFQGKDEYNKVVNSPNEYILDVGTVALLNA